MGERMARAGMQSQAGAGLEGKVRPSYFALYGDTGIIIRTFESQKPVQLRLYAQRQTCTFVQITNITVTFHLCQPHRTSARPTLPWLACNAWSNLRRSRIFTIHAGIFPSTPASTPSKGTVIRSGFSSCAARSTSDSRPFFSSS